MHYVGVNRYKYLCMYICITFLEMQTYHQAIIKAFFFVVTVSVILIDIKY